MSIVELLISMGIFGLLTGPILQAVLATQSVSQREETLLSQVQPVRGSFYQMVREIQMAGYPASNNFPPAIQAQSPGLIAAGFVEATATSIVFESDTDLDSTVERITYSVAPDGQSITRSVSLKAKDGTVGIPVSVQAPFIRNLVSNPGPPAVFSWEIDPASTKPFPNNISIVYLTLTLQFNLDPQKPSLTKVLTLSAAAHRINPSA